MLTFDHRLEIPNYLCLSRVVITAFGGIFLALFGPVPGVTFALAILVGLALFTDFLDGRLSRDLGATSRFGKWLDTSSDVLPRIFLHIAYLSLGWIHPIIPMILLGREFLAWAMRLMVIDLGVEVEAGSSLIGKVKTWAIGIGDFLTILLYAPAMQALLPIESTTPWIVGVIYTIACGLSIASMWTYWQKWAPGILAKNHEERVRQQTKRTQTTTT